MLSRRRSAPCGLSSLLANCFLCGAAAVAAASAASAAAAAAAAASFTTAQMKCTWREARTIPMLPATPDFGK